MRRRGMNQRNNERPRPRSPPRPAIVARAQDFLQSVVTIFPGLRPARAFPEVHNPEEDPEPPQKSRKLKQRDKEKRRKESKKNLKSASKPNIVADGPADNVGSADLDTRLDGNAIGVEKGSDQSVSRGGVAEAGHAINSVSSHSTTGSIDWQDALSNLEHPVDNTTGRESAEGPRTAESLTAVQWQDDSVAMAVGQEAGESDEHNKQTGEEHNHTEVEQDERDGSMTNEQDFMDSSTHGEGTDFPDRPKVSIPQVQQDIALTDAHANSLNAVSMGSAKMLHSGQSRWQHSTIEPVASTQHLPPQNELGHTVPEQGGISAPDIPDDLVTLRESDIENISRLRRFAYSAHQALTDLLWRVVIRANYFSNASPVNLNLPGHFQGVSSAQQRSEVAIRNSTLVGVPRDAPAQQAEIVEAVWSFLGRVRPQEEEAMARFIEANRDMALCLQEQLRNNQPATPHDLYECFVRSYGRYGAKNELDLGVSLRGLERLFERGESFGYDES